MRTKWLVRLLVIVTLGTAIAAVVRADDDGEGESGTQGPQGVQGPVGPQGAQGPQGIQGTQGQTGFIGPMGPQGVQGRPGVNGSNGSNGSNGLQGPQGNAGAPGIAGQTGATGKAGAQGIAGPQGLSGSSTDVPAIDPRLDVEVREYDAEHWAISSYASFGMQEGTSRYIVGQRLTLKLGKSSEQRAIDKLQGELERLRLQKVAFLGE